MPPEKIAKEVLECRTLIKTRERLFERLQITYDLIARLPEDEEIFLERAAKSISDLERFENVQSDLARLNQLLPAEGVVDLRGSSASYDDLHFRIQSAANKIRKANERECSTAGANTSARGIREGTLRPKLAPIQIPKFKGELDKFPAFQSLFESLVHDTDLPEIQKFSILKTSLEYPALSTIEHFEFTTENYATAYKKLVEKYTDKRLVGTHIFNRLLNYRSSTKGVTQNLNQFMDVFCVQYESLKSLQIPDLGEFVISTLALNTLDSETRRLFEEKYSDKTFPTFKELSDFVQQQCKVVSLVSPSHKGSTSSANLNKSTKSHRSFSTPPSTKSFLSKSQTIPKNSFQNTGSERRRELQLKCPICTAEHKIYACPEFAALSTNQRIDRIKGLKLCFSCLGYHARSNCTSKLSCRRCHDKNHHTFLHRDDNSHSIVSPTTTSLSDRTSSSPENSGPSVHVLKSQTNQVLPNYSSFQGLLGTAKARIQSTTGEWIPCRIVIDPASESSFITEHMVQSLRLSRKHFPVDVVGVGDARFSNHRGCVECRVTPFHKKQPTLSIEAIVLHSISSHLPKSPISSNIRERFRDLQLADPEFDIPNRIDLLIGVQHYSEILGDHIRHIQGEPAALSSNFGFIIFGKLPTRTQPSIVSSFLTHTPPVEELLKRFWEIEEPQVVTSSNPQDEECEKHFIKTTRRDHTGRYEVSLPFIQGQPPHNLGSTREIARKRLLNLERRLERNAILKKGYHNNIQDYLAQGHMRFAPNTSDYVMTHHAVVKDSASTKIRVVFNASEASDTSHTLNDFLAIGPKLQADISDILLKFRLHDVAITADITQMFRCIRLNINDARYTHILWRAESTSPIQEWELTTLPFGLRCSPYLAQRVIQQLVNDEGDQFSVASEALNSNIYVDDIVCSVPTEATAILLYNQLDQLLNRGGFVVHKVSSNRSGVLTHVPISKQESIVSLDQSDYIKLLGLKWDPQSDAFCYEVRTEEIVSTKRGILSQVARIFDVMGYLAPVTFWIKHLIQRLWVEKVGWDDELPNEISQVWEEFYEQLPHLKELKISRPLSITRPAQYDILGFCDASEKGYAACVYLRVQVSDTEIYTYLLKAKGKVAPLKTLTIPRLELLGANLLASLIDSISSFLSNLSSTSLYCFTDSSVVLAWIRTPSYQLKTFVANRVNRILDLIPSSSWYHVKGTANPADAASRGQFPLQFLNNTLWWEGPSFIRGPISTWPTTSESDLTEVPELKAHSLALMTTKVTPDSKDDFIEQLLQSHSSLRKTERILGYIRRFVTNLQLPAGNRICGPLSVKEIEDSLNTIALNTQRTYYVDVFKDLEQDRTPKGFLRYLTPVVSPEGLLRVGGRLTYAPLKETVKHPILIPRQSRFAELLCDYYHKTTLHGGPQLMQSLIQRTFWIPGIRSLLRNFVFRCISCYRQKAKPLEPFMSSLPSIRFKQVRAFINTGVDLAGPYLLKENKRRNSRRLKSWIILFICMSTRAVYIDVVEDISTPTFLAALDRFISRRGVPQQIWSDMGTNFVGAARVLADPINVLHSEKDLIQNYCDERKIKWKFNPPAAPHFGGSWEAAIKSMKHHLIRVMGDLVLTLPEFLTLLAKVEAILNSRPLGPISTNPSDGYDYLTPGHFLVGAPLLLSRPEEDLLQEPPSLNARWTLISRCVQDFWKRWSTAYLNTLMQRSKWTRRTPNVQPGDMVLLLDPSLPPTLWRMGRILEGLAGRDGIIRVVKVRTTSGILTRPLTKLCLLPLPTTEDTLPPKGMQLRSGRSTAGS